MLDLALMSTGNLKNQVNQLYSSYNPAKYVCDPSLGQPKIQVIASHAHQHHKNTGETVFYAATFPLALCFQLSVSKQTLTGLLGRL